MSVVRTRQLVKVMIASALVATFTAAGAQAQGRPGAELSLASQTPWVRSGEPFVVRVDVQDVREPGDLDVDVTVHRAVTSRSQFVQTLTGSLLGRAVARETVPFEALRFDAGGAAPLRIDLPDGLRPGVYPASVVVRDAAGQEVDALYTHAVRVPDERAKVPLSVAWVQDYGAPPALRPDGSVALDDDVLDELRVVAAQLDRGVPLTIAPVPETVAALATVDGGRTTSALAELLEPHQVLWQPYVDVDVAALTASRGATEIADQRAAGAAVLDELDLDRDARTWALRGAVTTEVLAAVAALGTDRVVVDDESLAPLDPDLTSGLTLTRPFALEAPGRRLDAVAMDAGLASHFDEDDDVLAAHHLLAELAVLQLDSPGTNRGVVIRPPEGWVPSEGFLSTAIGGLATSPLLEATTLDGLFDAVDPLTDDGDPVVRSPREDASVRSADRLLGRIEQARADVASLESLADGGDESMADLDRLLLVAMSSRLTRRESDRYTTSVTERVSAAASNVRVFGDRSYRLTAREGTVPLTIVNDNDFDIVVDLELSSDKLAFTGAGVNEPLGARHIDSLLLAAGATSTQAVPVKARTSGTSSLRVAMRSPDGRIELARSSITVTSTFASWVGYALSLGALAFLVLWWASHFRTVRRARKLVPAA